MLIALAASGFVGNMFMSKALQDVWGLLNS